MSDLAEFLLARVAEDEAAAREGRDLETLLQHVQWDNEDIRGAERHFARHDPARVLADCAAKRRIVKEHSRPVMVPTADGDEDNDYNYCGVCGAAEREPEAAPCPTLRILASPYAAHPEFRPEWRPSNDETPRPREEDGAQGARCS